MKDTFELKICVKPEIGEHIELSFTVNKNDKIFDVKNKIKELHGFEVDFQKIFYDGMFLSNEKTLAQYSIDMNPYMNVWVITAEQQKKDAEFFGVTAEEKKSVDGILNICRLV